VIAPIAGEEARAAAEAADVDLAAIEQSLVAVAVGASHERLAQVVHVYREALDPDGAEPDPTEGRRLSITRHADGSRSLRGELDAVGGEKWKDHPLPTTRKLAAGPWGWPHPRPAERRLPWCRGVTTNPPPG